MDRVIVEVEAFERATVPRACRRTDCQSGSRSWCPVAVLDGQPSAGPRCGAGEAVQHWRQRCPVDDFEQEDVAASAFRNERRQRRRDPRAKKRSELGQVGGCRAQDGCRLAAVGGAASLFVGE